MERSEYETTRAVSRRGALPPKADEHPYLVGIAGEHAGRFFPLNSLAELTIGRTPDCEIPVLIDDIVSRRHVRIEAGATGQVRLFDLNSTNGTLVNGREVATATLRRGDRIFLGQSTIFKFDYYSDEERANYELARLDALTECYNRGFFDARLEELYRYHVERDRPLSLILFDIDLFKDVNDGFGHQAGDFVLQQVAATLVAELDRIGIDAHTCRYGGEEFAILIPHCDAAACARIAETIRAAVAESAFEFEGVVLRVTISGGVATFVPRNFESPARLLKAADDNLLSAKKSGRNKVVS